MSLAQNRATCIPRNSGSIRRIFTSSECFVPLKDGTQTQETQFNKYQKLGGGWIAAEVIFMVDGKVVTTESTLRFVPT